ncbi:hypothetical protein E4656_13190 [Natronospirillum operosum]|uniref:Big-1 domain-containing protein n=1 Tax=Natronospirillum operosum TaxID=2759953 RepID=A0A4Z0WC24_9GAMM|nr:hypothetical protein [Natronospirillum operosum]TGG92425.1 hypothetical protein E4656_13190 [Natronospirillum operosum]
MSPCTHKPLLSHLLVLLAVTALAACNPSTESGGNSDNGNGDGGGGNGGNDNNGDLVELDYGVGFVLVMDPAPNQIALRGYGTGQIPETTRLAVQVLDNDLNPVAGHDVSFAITDSTGGPELTRDSATTGSDGSASTILRSGTVQGTTQVEVSMDLLDSNGNVIEQDVHVATTQPVSMHTAAPVTDGMSLSADVFNPEGYDYNGIPVQVTVHLGDIHRNPVADGTQVNFLASTGLVDPVCTTDNGACTIEWRSAHPRGDGRVDILARTNGNDAFVDTNGNSRFDLGESYEPQGEPFVDTEGTGQFDPGDFFWDLSGTGDYTPADPGAHYKGIGCTEDALEHGHCDERAVVFNNIVLVASGSDLRLDPEPTDVSVSDTVIYQMVDQNGNVPPAGSDLSINCTDASATALDSEVPERPGALFGPWPVVINYGDDPGSCTLEVQSPNGLPQRYTISVN